MTATDLHLDSVPERAEQRLVEAVGWFSLGARLIFAAILTYAAATKIGDPQETVRAVRAYKLLPEGLVVPFAHALPWLELALAVLLVAGLAVRFCGLVGSALMAMFVVGMISAWARGLKIDCGCFGGGGPNPNPQYARDLFRDAAFLAIAVAIAVLPRSRWALDPGPPLASSAVVVGASRRERQRAVGEEQRRQRVLRLRRRQLVSAMAILAMSVVVGIAAGSAMTPGPPDATPQGVTSRGGIVVGSASAPRLVVVYEDPQCPTCEKFELSTGWLLDGAVAQGLVRVEYRMRSFLGPESVRAVAALGAAADEGRFDQLRRQLFAHQPVERTGGFTVDDLLRLGQDVGLTSESYVGSVRSQRYAAWARKVDDLASQAGNVGTPEVILDGGSIPLEVLFDEARFAALLGASR